MDDGAPEAVLPASLSAPAAGSSMAHSVQQPVNMAHRYHDVGLSQDA